MNIVKSRGIIIKTQDYKENDKLIWIFTEEFGKISAIAKGARKNKSKLFSSTLPFCFGEYILYKGRNLYTLNEGRIIDSFQDILNEYETLIYGSYFNELIDISMEEEKNPQLFKDLIKTFYIMRNKAIDLEILARAFEIKLLQATGYGINLDRCCICDEKMDDSSYISFQFYGGICSKCEKIYGTLVSRASYNGIKFLTKLEVEKVGRISLDEKTKKEMEKIIHTFINNNYNRKPKSLTMLDCFKDTK